MKPLAHFVGKLLFVVLWCIAAPAGVALCAAAGAIAGALFALMWLLEGVTS